jgi:hypothetical protein
MEALMREDELPSPGLINGGARLRREVANAISYIQVNARADGLHSEAHRLVAFMTAASAALADFAEAVPTNSVNVAISGTAQVGQTLTVSAGTWAGGGLTFTRQWKKAGVAISGATGTTYVPVVGDIGAAITCTVTGTNNAGSLAKTSAATSNVIAA